MRQRSISTIVGLGIVTAIFMAMMSMFYLQQIPTAEEARALEHDLRREHGIYLAATAPLSISLLRPRKEGERTGVEVTCTMRPDIRKAPKTVEMYLGRIGDSVLRHPTWQGRIAFVTVRHTAPLPLSVTREAAPASARK